MSPARPQENRADADRDHGEHVGHGEWAGKGLMDTEQLDDEAHRSCRDKIGPQHEKVGTALAPPSQQQPHDRQECCHLIELSRMDGN